MSHNITRPTTKPTTKPTQRIALIRYIVACIVALLCQRTVAATVSFEMVIDTTCQTFEVFAFDTFEDNVGIAGFNIQIFNFDTVAIVAPQSTISATGHNWGFSLNSEIYPDPDPTKIFAIQDFTYTQGDDTFIDPDQVFYGFGQIAGSDGPPHLTTQVKWYALARIIHGTYDGILPSFGESDANVWDDPLSLTSFQATTTTIIRDKIPGDYNNDGYVDQADFTTWADSFGDTGGYLPADGNNNGVIDQADFTTWADHFGEGAPPIFAPCTVPEPTTLILIAVGSLCITIPRQQQR